MINLNFWGEDERRALGTELVSDLTAKTLWRQTISNGSAQKISVCFSLTLNNTLTYGFCNFSEKEGLTEAEFLFRRRIYIIFFVLYITFSVDYVQSLFFSSPIERKARDTKVSRVWRKARDGRGPLAHKCTTLTNSEEKERLLEVYVFRNLPALQSPVDVV